MALSAGTRLGPYEIIVPIGAGGMGEVYRALDSQLEREVAIKILPKVLASNPESLARFDREAKILAALNHPNIAVIYGLIDSNGQRALVMELVPGDTLAARIKSHPLTRDEALQAAKQIAEALEAAHERNIVHRDLKPGNVMITPAGVVKVLDFGLAATASPTPPAGDPNNSPTITLTMTQAGAILGTAAYMSPEQASGTTVDRRSDIWSFGVLLWEMLTSKRLFGPGETISHTLADVIRAPIDLTAIPAGPVRKLLKRCLDRNLKTRLQSIAEARIAIDEILAGTSSEDAPPPAPLPILGKRSWIPWALAALAIAAAVLLAVILYRQPLPELVKLEFPPPEKTRLVTRYGPPALSPDGRRIAFTALADGRRMLWVRDLDSLTARMLPGTEGAIAPFWAPDSRQIAFFSSAALMKIDVTGGPATTVVAQKGVSAYRSGTWNQHGILVFSDLTSGLFRVPAAGGTPEAVTLLDKSRNETSHYWPHFLPDGRHFLYTALSTDSDKTAVFVGDLQSKDKKPLVQVASNAQYVATGHILFARERKLMAQPFDTAKLETTGDAIPIAERLDYRLLIACAYFGASRNGVLAYASGGAGDVQQITWHDRSGRPLGTVGNPVDIQNARLSPNGKMVAIDRRDAQASNRDIWIHDLARGTEQRLTFAGTNLAPVWSPDSLRVAYFTSEKGQVVAKAADGTGQEELLETARQFPMDWTRDGFLLTATPGTAGNNDIWSLPLSPPVRDRKPVPLLNTEFSEWNPRVSPDGRWLAYMSTQSKRREVYVVGFPSLNGRWQISANGGQYPVWSRDGRELYFVSLDNKLMAVPVTPGAQFQHGVPKPLFDVRLDASANNANFDVSADGRFLIATPVEQTSSVPMTVVLNWQAALRKQ